MTRLLASSIVLAAALAGCASNAAAPSPTTAYITPAPTAIATSAPTPTPQVVYVFVTPGPLPTQAPSPTPTPTPTPTPKPTPKPAPKPTPKPTPTLAPPAQVKHIVTVTNQLAEGDYGVSVYCPTGYLLLDDTTLSRMYAKGTWGNTSYSGGYTGDIGNLTYGDYDGPLLPEAQGWFVGSSNKPVGAGSPDDPVTVWARCYK
jgi:hypothetical protein